jgi:hypothetical protein
VRTRIVRIVQVILVVRRVLGMLDHKILKARPPHGPVELAGHGQHGVAEGLSLQSAAIGVPEIAVVDIERRGARG